MQINEQHIQVPATVALGWSPAKVGRQKANGKQEQDALRIMALDEQCGQLQERVVLLH